MFGDVVKENIIKSKPNPKPGQSNLNHFSYFIF